MQRGDLRSPDKLIVLTGCCTVGAEIAYVLCDCPLGARMSRVSVPLTTVQSPEFQPITWGWALRRAALGIVILTSAVGLVAWLTYSSIDPAPSAIHETGTEKTAAAF